MIIKKIALLLLLVAQAAAPCRGTSSRRSGRLRRGRGRKIKEWKRGKEAGSQAGPHPKVPWGKGCRVGGAGKYVSGGVWGGVAGGAEVVRGSADPLQVTVEGRPPNSTPNGAGIGWYGRDGVV